MKEPIRVRMAEYSIGKCPDILVTIGLGSCIGIALYDGFSKIGGLVHIMLPKDNRNGLKPSKYADTGIPFLVDKMIESGADKSKLTAKIAGGAHMFSNSGDISFQIGRRNIEAVRKILSELNIPITGEDIGEDYGRTMEFYTVDGSVKIRTYKKGNLII